MTQTHFLYMRLFDGINLPFSSIDYVMHGMDRTSYACIVRKHRSKPAYPSLAYPSLIGLYIKLWVSIVNGATFEHSHSDSDLVELCTRLYGLELCALT